ncbi:hypothetical protein Tco_1290653 [Tanacetum coccineum]
MQADISSIKGMVTEMLQAFKGMSSSTPSGGASIPTTIQPEVNASVRGEFVEVMIDIISPEQPKNLPVAPKADRRKGITTDDTESPKKLVKASTVVRPDPDEPVRKIRKAAEEAKLLEMSKPELIKVVQEEATKAGFNPKILAKCNMILPEGVPFVNNMVIKEPEYGMFFIDVFGDEAFQRMSDINKVGVEALKAEVKEGEVRLCGIQAELSTLLYFELSCVIDNRALSLSEQSLSELPSRAQPESIRKTLAFSEAVLSE